MAWWSSLASAGGGMASSYLAGRYGQRISREQMQSEREMLAQRLGLQREMWETGRADIAPWMEAGRGALGRIQALYGMGGEGQPTPGEILQQDPSYRFRVGEGQRALERSAAARGGTFSGRTGRALVDYGQRAGSQEFGNVANRLAALAGLGQTAAGTAGQYGMQTAGMGSQAMGQAAGRMGGYMTQALQSRQSMYSGFNESIQNLIQNLDYEYGDD